MPYDVNRGNTPNREGRSDDAGLNIEFQTGKVRSHLLLNGFNLFGQLTHAPKTLPSKLVLEYGVISTDRRNTRVESFGWCFVV